MQTRSPINKTTIEGQNSRLLSYLSSGRAIHVFSAIKRRMQIGYLNSRISDLRKLGVKITAKWIKARNQAGKVVSCKSYSLSKD